LILLSISYSNRGKGEKGTVLFKKGKKGDGSIFIIYYISLILYIIMKKKKNLILPL